MQKLKVRPLQIDRQRKALGSHTETESKRQNQWKVFLAERTPSGKVRNKNGECGWDTAGTRNSSTMMMNKQKAG